MRDPRGDSTRWDAALALWHEKGCGLDKAACEAYERRRRILAARETANGFIQWDEYAKAMEEAIAEYDQRLEQEARRFREDAAIREYEDIFKAQEIWNEQEAQHDR